MDFTLAAVSPVQQTKWLRVLYKEATQIVERLGAAQLVLHSHNSRRLLPHLGCDGGVKVYLIPAIPRSALLSAVWHPQPPTKPHPLTIHSQRVGDEQIQEYVKYSKHLRKFVLPVFDDLQFRLAFRLLPVRSRFWFLQQSHPGIIYCIRARCTAVETEQHLFFECPFAAGLWEHFVHIMAPFVRSHLTWAMIATATKPVVRDKWKQCEYIITDLWHTLRAVMLHFIWSDRNRCLFDGRQPTPLTSALMVIFTTASAHFRHNLRRRYDAAGRASLEQALLMMRRYPPFGDFAKAHPALFQIRHLHL